MRSALQPISSVQDSQKLSKGRSVKPPRHAYDLHSTSTFQKEILGRTEHCDLS